MKPQSEPLTRERMLHALGHLTVGLAPDDAGVRRLLEQLDALYEEITDEAVEAVRSVLAEAGARALLIELTTPPQAAPGADVAAGDAISPADGSEALPGPPNALVSVQEACGKRARRCLTCDVEFEVNFRHADKHKFCSAACRSRHRRVLACHKSTPESTGTSTA